MKDKKIESLIQKLLNNSLNKDFWLALAQDQVKAVGLMDTSLKENNLNFMLKKLNPERNDSYPSYTY
jgi:hypothetical protein